MKKPNKYTEIKKETIIGVFAFMVLAVIITVLMQSIYFLLTKEFIPIRTDTEIYFIFDLAISGFIVVAITAVTFVIITDIAKSKHWLPDIKGVIRIPNPMNKNHFVMNKRTNRPDVTYYRRRPWEWFGWLKLPRFVGKKLEKMLIPIIVLILAAIGFLSAYIDLGFLVYALSWLIVIIVVWLIFYVIANSMWPDRKPIISENEYKEMIPHLEKLDNLLYTFGFSDCYYRKRFWIVSQEEYDEIVKSLA